MVAVVVIGLKVIPPYFSNYEFEDYIKNEAMQATYATRSEDDIRDSVIKHASDYDIHLTAKQVRVVRSGGIAGGSLAIEVDYTVPIELPGYTTTLEFHPSTKNKSVY
jgi:hypothetical protein